jgi:hypothetical protein
VQFSTRSLEVTTLTESSFMVQSASRHQNVLRADFFRVPLSETVFDDIGAPLNSVVMW